MVSNSTSTPMENTFNFHDALLKKLLNVNIGIVDEVGDDDFNVEDFDRQYSLFSTVNPREENFMEGMDKELNHYGN